MNIRSNTNATDTWYYKQALHVLQDSILFGERLYSTSSEPSVPRDKKEREKKMEQRRLAKNAMDKWYSDNESSLFWDESISTFVKADGDDKMPVEVYDLFTH